MTSTMARSRRRRRRGGSPVKKTVAALLTVALLAVAAYYALIYPPKVEKVVYPIGYEDIIRKYCDEYSLQPERVAAVIYCESSFRPEVVSSAGAVGLMQIMPQTGEWIAKKLGIENYTDALLTDPDVNIRMGCWYLNYLDGRFDYDIRKSTAAYQAGGGTVDKWLDDPANSPDGVTLETIPSKVTGDYVGKVIDTIPKYKEIIT